MKKIITLISFGSIITSCAIQGFTNDYKILTDVQKSTIVSLNSFENADDLNKVYKINGAQLREELKSHPKALVYVFKNGCTSEYCKPLYIYENYAKENNYKLFLVMNGYGNMELSTIEASKNPLFSIDNEYYNKNYRTVYIRYFENDMLNKDLKHKDKEYLGNLFFFENGDLKEIRRDLPIK